MQCRILYVPIHKHEKLLNLKFSLVGGSHLMLQLSGHNTLKSVLIIYT
jgi:hypothetical protein